MYLNIFRRAKIVKISLPTTLCANFFLENRSLAYFSGEWAGTFLLVEVEKERNMYKIVIFARSAETRRLVALTVGGLGAHVVEVDSWHELLRVCRSGDVAVALLLSAAELLSSPEGVAPLRRFGRRPSLYLLTWHHSEQVALSLLERGVDQCMTFPLTLTRLRRKVAEAVTAGCFDE